MLLKFSLQAGILEIVGLYISKLETNSQYKARMINIGHFPL